MMKRIFARCFLLMLCACLLACAIPATAANETSGKCGDNVTWSFDEQTRTLTISGTGEMNNDPFGHEMRWAHLYNKIRYIVIEDGITAICDYAFEGSTELKEVTIPESVTYIGESAFERAGLHHIDLHDGITYIGISAFEWSSLEKVTVPAGVKELSFGVFRRCGNLKSVVLPEGLTTIHGDAFTDCTALESIVIPNSVTIMEDAFLRCSALMEITLSQNLETIYTSCFQDCTALREINIPDSVTVILKWAFENCVALEKVTLGTGVGEISPSAFSGCDSLKSYVVSEENTTFANDEHGVIYSKDGSRLELIPSGFTGEYTVAQGTQVIGKSAGSGCAGLSKLVIPDSVTEIDRHAFQDCVSIKILQLGNGLQIIRAEAFRGCESLEVLTIPASVTYLDNNAFGLCDALRTIEFLGDRPYFESYVFADVKADAWYPAGNSTWENNFPEDAYHVIWHPGCGGAHTFVDEEAAEPTCETNGKLSSTYCSTCGFVSVYPTEIPATGHNYGAWKYISPDGTPARERMVARICETCSHEQKEYAYKLNPAELPAEAPSDTQPISPDEKEPIRFTGGQIVIIAIVVVAVCFVGVEVYLLLKKKKAKQS